MSVDANGKDASAIATVPNADPKRVYTLAIVFTPGTATLSADQKQSLKRLATGTMFSDSHDQVDYRARLSRGTYRVVLRTSPSAASTARRDAVAAALNVGEQHPISVELEQASDLGSDTTELVVVSK